MNYIKDLVSTIIPVFNSENFIENTLESVLFQTYHPIEIIIIDDCSKDNSEKIIKKYIERYPQKIKYLKLKKNRGVSVARNIGMKHAKGQYIAFLDSDDLWKKKKVELQINLLKKTQAAFSFTAIEMIDINNKVVKAKRSVSQTITYEQLLKNTMIATSSVIVNRYITGDFVMPESRIKKHISSVVEDYSIAEDYATWLKLLRKYGKAVGINKSLVQYRKGNTGLSKGKFKSLKRVYRVQTQLEHIKVPIAIINCGYYIINAIKKHFF